MLGENFSDLIVFMAVVDAGSFTAGGRAKGLTRSAAGKAVGRLENSLGVRLLNRTTRALSVTDEGKALHERCLAVLSLLDDAEASVTGRAGTPRGVLRLTVPDGFGRLVLLPLLGRYLADWPDLRADVSFTDRRADIVEEGFDLAIRIDGATTDSRLVSRLLARYERVLVASPDYLARHGEPTSLDELGDHSRLVFTSRGRRQGWRFRGDDGSWIAAQGASRLRLDSGEALRDAAVAGLGIALLPNFVVAGDLEAGRLRRVLPDLVAGDVEVAAVYPSKRLLEPRVRLLIDLLVDKLGA